MNEFLAALPFSLLLVASTGPVFFVIIETSISRGARRAFCVDLGAVLADIIFILIALLGAKTVHQSLESNPYWYLLGGVVLFVFGLLSLFITRKHKSKIVFASEELSRGNFLFFIAKGFLLNFINIGVFLFWLGLVVVFGAKYQMDNTKLLYFFGYILIIYLSFDWIKIYLAKQLKTILTPQVIYKLKQFVHLILMVFGLFFVFQGAFPEQKQKIENRIEERLK
jgi:threonine/homoserine/homoserine lactone efflux protein